jgi:ABC-type dipeptide/oligopeptide/nickel transport system permease component
MPTAVRRLSPLLRLVPVLLGLAVLAALAAGEGRLLWLPLRRLLLGEWGLAAATGQPIARELLAALPASLHLLAAALVLALVLGVPLGLSAARPPSWLVGAAGAVAAALALRHGLPTLPPLLPPALTLGLPAALLVAELLGAARARVLAQEHLHFARAMGRPPWLPARALAAAAPGLLPLAGLLLGGLPLAEALFRWPGLGGYLAGAIINGDHAALPPAVLLLALGCALARLAPEPSP